MALSSSDTDREAPTNGFANPKRPHRRTLSVIIPTYNEAENIPVLLDRLEVVLDHIDYEIIVVDDDSPDKTWKIAGERSDLDSRIQVIRRVGARGLSAAVLSGMDSARGKALVVIDADLQHDERVIPDLIAPILAEDADVVLGSREAEGGSYGEFSQWRRFVSWGGATVARRMLGVAVSDPMSGFFAVSSRRYDELVPSINAKGFKILLEFLARGDKPRVAEVGYEFRNRLHGDTKLSGSVIAAYLLALLDLAFGRLFSSTFLAYALVGTLGVLVRLSGEVVFGAAGLASASALAFAISVFSNFWFNNRFTFAPYRYTGWSVIRGLTKFSLFSVHGVLVQIGILSVASNRLSPYEKWSPTWFWINGLAISIATLGNFALNSNLTWRRRL